MAAELKKAFPGTEVKLMPSSGGRFEVFRDDVPIFQKSKVGRHADEGEVVRLLEKLDAKKQDAK